MSGPRPIWKGHLKIALVVIPVKVFAATESSDTLAFHQLHATCKGRLKQKRWCPTCELEVPVADLVKGFEFEKDHYVVLAEADFDTVRPDSTHMIDLTRVSPSSALDPVTIQRSYYLVPDGTRAAAALRVVRVGMTQAHQVAKGKLAVYGREYLVAVRPAGPVLLLHTLYHAAELRSAEGIAEDEPPNAQAPASEVKLFKQVMATLDGPWAVEFRDEYQAQLQAVIDAKIAGEEIVTSEPVTTRPVLDLVSALQASLKLKPAKAKKRRIA